MSKHTDPIVIVSAARTPIGGFQGALAGLTSTELGAHAIEHAVLRARLGNLTSQINEVAMGCVLTAGLGQAPARQATLDAGLSLETNCATINKMCGSGMKAIMMVCDSLLANSCHIAVAGGMESMSNAPYLLPKVRSGMQMGHGQILDHLFLDGLEDAYNKGRLMGTFAQECADEFQFTRQALDTFAMQSLERSRQARASGAFSWEIAPMELNTSKGIVRVEHDEEPFRSEIEKHASLKPFPPQKKGAVTAANSAAISDGAAALVLMRLSKAQTLQLQPIAKILGHASHAQQPSLFTTAPVGAINKLFAKTGLQAQQIDLFEINETFAVVTMAAMQQLALPPKKVNIHGGACALGHPLGASGARIVCTLLGALKHTGGKTGVAAICMGGGEATAIALEIMN